MKVVFALVVLLHLCHSKDNKKVYKEIIDGLKELGPANISLSSCVSCYVKELKRLLDNVTVNKSNKHIIQGLQANLQILNLGCGSCTFEHREVPEQKAGGERRSEVDPKCTSACPSVPGLTSDL
ncbi:hypothetical protein KUCAC02_004185 [Chaenocephalus aceratus]|uniref:Uncharacterized protein n=1 Tax=Chaenocephalus aceratus TaxID=36190 RepID=A0ACB9WYI9_CHAAC|nr:hypothetical protein KUCAC02_004185 [Chaenocephalus aceratus]